MIGISNLKVRRLCIAVKSQEVLSLHANRHGYIVERIDYEADNQTNNHTHPLTATYSPVPPLEFSSQRIIAGLSSRTVSRLSSLKSRFLG